MSYRTYPAYQRVDGGFIGAVPNEWQLKKLKFTAAMNADVLPEDTDPDLEFEYVDIGSVTFGAGIQSTEHMRFSDAPSRARRLVKSGDVIVSTVRTYLKAIAPIDQNAANLVVSTGFCVVRPSASLHANYCHYLLQAPFFVDAVVADSVGVSYPATNASAIASILVPLPSVEEQSTIANFLDSETAKIDTLIEKQERLIKLLEEKRQAVISHAVTKGLNPDVRMKDSGVEWLGEVPEHWEVAKLKHLAYMKSGDGITAESIEEHGPYPVYGGNGIRGYTTSYTHEGAFPLIGRQGALCGNINYATGRFWASEHAVVVAPRENVYFKWLGEVLRAMNLNQYSISAAQPGLSVDTIANLSIPHPSEPEQRAIAEYLDRNLDQGNAVRGMASRGVELLKERRTALISAAVTGKIDVRNAV